tara:strand:+ start:8669 stop:9340 length:672 start_codon:yes stop_codon:yes gene_type:complete
MDKPINNHPMQIREDLQEEEHIPVWNTLTGECVYIKHTPTLNVEYMWSPDEGEGLNDEGANTILLIHHGEGQVYERSVGAHRAEDDPRPRQIIKDTLVFAISIDWEDKEPKTCVPEVPAAHDWAREILHAKAHPKPRPKTYRLAIREEISGFIDVEAESQEEAEDIARELMDTHGVDTLFYPPKESQYTHDDDLTKYNGDHTHRNAEVLECVERTNSGEYKNL